MRNSSFSRPHPPLLKAGGIMIVGKQKILNYLGDPYYCPVYYWWQLLQYIIYLLKLDSFWFGSSWKVTTTATKSRPLIQVETQSNNKNT